MPNLQFERFEWLLLDGHECEIEFAILKASMGDGYQQSALVGSPLGLKTWRIGYGHLHRSPHRRSGRFAVEAVADYVWDFFCRRMAEGDSPFVMRDPRTKKDFLVGFKDTKLSYRALLQQFYQTSIEVVERREVGVNFLEDGSLGESINPDVI